MGIPIPTADLDSAVDMGIHMGMGMGMGIEIPSPWQPCLAHIGETGILEGTGVRRGANDRRRMESRSTKQIKRSMRLPKTWPAPEAAATMLARIRCAGSAPRQADNMTDRGLACTCGAQRKRCRSS